MKINFKQPKFILPLIFLPFILLFFWIFSTWGSKKQNAELAKADSLSKIKQDEINPVLPGASPEVNNQQIEGKFESYQEAYKHTRDASAMQTINIPLDSSASNRYTSSYSKQDIDRLSAEENLRKLQEQLARSQNSSTSQMERIMAGGNRTAARSPEEILALAKQQNFNANGEAPYRRSSSGSGTTGEQMTVFREQMKVMDSMRKVNESIEYSGSYSGAGTNAREKKEKFDPIIPSKDSSYKPLPVSLTPLIKNNSAFNTIRATEPENSIKAILDQDERESAGGRVRIKLLDDIYVGDNKIAKGSYLYGMITGFQTQRVNITITQIMYNSNPLPVHLDVFDNDGYLGLYVPGSNFREFTKEIGTQSTSGLSSVQTSNGSQDITASLLSRLLQSSGSSVTKLIRQNKVNLKYNYIVYLKEKNK